jgi:hypothetical protein
MTFKIIYRGVEEQAGGYCAKIAYKVGRQLHVDRSQTVPTYEAASDLKGGLEAAIVDTIIPDENWGPSPVEKVWPLIHDKEERQE